MRIYRFAWDFSSTAETATGVLLFSAIAAVVVMFLA
jgi:hypothetical protein